MNINAHFVEVDKHFFPQTLYVIKNNKVFHLNFSCFNLFRLRYNPRQNDILGASKLFLNLWFLWQNLLLILNYILSKDFS